MSELNELNALVDEDPMPTGDNDQKGTDEVVVVVTEESETDNDQKGTDGTDPEDGDDEEEESDAS